MLAGVCGFNDRIEIHNWNNLYNSNKNSKSSVNCKQTFTENVSSSLLAKHSHTMLLLPSLVILLLLLIDFSIVVVVVFVVVAYKHYTSFYVLLKRRYVDDINDGDGKCDFIFYFLPQPELVSRISLVYLQNNYSTSIIFCSGKKISDRFRYVLAMWKKTLLQILWKLLFLAAIYVFVRRKASVKLHSREKLSLAFGVEKA